MIYGHDRIEPEARLALCLPDANGPPELRLQLYSASIDFGLDIQEAMRSTRDAAC